jgi:hypothetical protein
VPPAAPLGAGRLRRLTQAQLENSVRDLLASGAQVGAALSDPGMEDPNLASVSATYAALTDAAVEAYHTAMQALLTKHFADANLRTATVGVCTPAGVEDAACFRSFVTGFGRRAWRRPLGDAEVDRYTKLATDAAKALKDPWRGLAYASAGLLLSPSFIYRVELGAPDPAAGGRYRYTSWETASRLGFFLTGSIPDVELLAAAESGQLDRPEGVRAQALRLLASEKARTGLGNFARELMKLDHFVQESTKEPRYTRTLREAMRAEVIHMFQGLLAPGSGALDFLDTTKAFVTAELATIYEIPGITGATAVEAPLPAHIPRAGLLGSGAFLAMTSIPKMEEGTTSPTARGVYINEAILCREIPPPPPNVGEPMLPAGATPTKREFMELHRADPGCAACHALFDPIGFAFENFDWVGANRQLDNGKPIDTRGTYQGFAYQNSRELLGYLKKLPDTQRCFVNHLFRYANGHNESEAHEPVVEAWDQELTRQDRNLGKFLTEMVASDGFRFVSVPPADGTH